MNSSLIIDTAALSSFRRAHCFGFNTCHAPIVMRSDLQDHIRRAHNELGMRYWRCHGTLSDEVGILDPHAKTLDFTFSGLKRILDTALRAGVKPFFELSFMPSVLARDPARTITHYRGIVTPPKQWVDWEKLIEALMRFLVDEYGVEELRTWYFEVWNEPNIPFWVGTQEEYFQLYRLAALAIKKADPQFRVGGPATARADWVKEILNFCQNTGTPIDFISTHIYPSDVAFVDSAVGDVQLFGVDFLYEHFKRVRQTVDAVKPGLPVVWGEWNSSAGPLADNHDECNNAPFIAATLAGIENWAEGSLFWNLSDIYEECQYHFSPFHGGYGMYTVNGVPKSAARAFEFWNSLAGLRAQVHGLPDTATVGAFATYESKAAQLSLLLWNHNEPENNFDEWVISLRLPFKPKGEAKIASILPRRGSAYEAWIEMGKPLNLSREQAKELHAASVPCLSSAAFDTAGEIHFTIPSGTLHLLTVQC